MRAFFVSDLHGSVDRYHTLFSEVRKLKPHLLFLGGDLFPHGLTTRTETDQIHADFVNQFLAPEFSELMSSMGADYPQVFLILGNDDLRSEESNVVNQASKGIWHYAHNQRFQVDDYSIYGYSFVPPTPFLLKDWERYDVSRYLDPGDISPEDGIRSVKESSHSMRYDTIAKDLASLADQDDLSTSVFLFHAPPHKTKLDRCQNDGLMIDHVPLDLHVGSIAIRNFIKIRQPLLTLHGHIHESCRLTGAWQDQIGSTTMLSAAHDGPELALVKFDLEDPANAERELI